MINPGRESQHRDEGVAVADELGSTVVLLGAGASVDAGLPTSRDMTERLVRRLEEGRGWRHEKERLALNFAVGAMVAHDTGRGASPFAGIDVERLFSAVTMLGELDDLEVTPFVSAWAAPLASIGTDALPPFFDSDFIKAVRSEHPGKKPSDLLTKLIRNVAGGRSSSEAYRSLRQLMLSQLLELLVVDPEKVDYLKPLLALGGTHSLTIATLNYDRTVEHMAERAGEPIDTGINAWNGGFDWTWDPERRVRLLKLHGSVDWVLRGKSDPIELRMPPSLFNTASEDFQPNSYADRPALIFGRRDKLTAEGPFLAMLRAFDDALSGCEHLLVVGYSFGDPHINSAIAKWVHACPHGRVDVVDPAFPADSGMWVEAFALSLTRAMQERGDASGRHQIRIVREGAARALPGIVES
jgi:hypothetical protein